MPPAVGTSERANESSGYGSGLRAGNGTRRAEVPFGVVGLCGAVAFACSFYLLATNASLVGDGSYYLLRAIQTGGAFSLSGRELTNLIREGPLLVGLASGVKNTHNLTLLEGVGFLLLPALVWTLALAQARHCRVHFTLVAVSCGLCFATMVIYSASELTLALPLVVLASVMLARPSQWSGGNAALVVAATALLFMSHESIAPCVVVLGTHAVWRARAGVGPRDVRASIVVAALSVVVFVAAVWTLVFRPNSNSTDFLKNVEDLTPLSMIALGIAAACLLGWVALDGRLNPDWLRWPLLAPAVLFTLLGVQSAIHSGPGAAYAERGWCVIVVVVLQLLLFLDWLRPKWMVRRQLIPTASRGGVLAAAAFFLVVMTVPFVYAARWSSVTSVFQTTITHHTGVVPWSSVDTPLAKTYLTLWTNPTLSLILRSSSTDAVVANKKARLDPFSITSAEHQISPTYRWGN